MRDRDATQRGGGGQGVVREKVRANSSGFGDDAGDGRARGVSYATSG